MKAMKTLMVLMVAMVAVAGCGTTLEQKSLVKFAPNLGSDAVAALKELKQLPLLQKVAQDSKATRAYAEGKFGVNGKTPDPLKLRLATACPDATDAVGQSIVETIDQVIAKVNEINAPTDPNVQQGYLMLFLTQLKYGDQQSPQNQLRALQDKLNLQFDAVFAGCAHLFPQKQVNDVAKLLARAGITGFSGGALAPVLSILP